MNWKRIFPACVFIGTLTLFANTGVAQYVQSNLVANRTGLQAGNIDPHLLNAWGLTLCRMERHEGDAERQESFESSDQDSLFCVADAFAGFATGAGVATVYTRSGRKIPIEVTVPPGSGSPFFPVGLPAGIVFNATSDFVISKNGKSGPAVLIFATLDGTISGWNPDVDATNAIIMVDYSANKPNRQFPAGYTGLAKGRDSQGRNVIYAADGGFNTLETSNNEIDMFGGSFEPIGIRHFTDLNTNLPDNPGMTVYGIQNVKGKLYVTFATFTALGGGVVDIFDTDGNLLTPEHFAANAGNSGAGSLQAPWGLALAPDDFGQFSDAILVGNVDDGHINAFNRHTRQFLGQLADANGNLLGADGLWGLLFDADGRNEGKTNKLFFTAGPNGYADGLFGVISPVKDEHRENAAVLKKAIPALLASPVQKQRAGRPHPHK
jgi:uncharacterized protein (TIGR03118 family)